MTIYAPQTKAGAPLVNFESVAQTGTTTATLAEGIVPLGNDTPLDLAALVTVYDSLQAWNFSYEFLSRIPEHLVVTRADTLGWSDWGTKRSSDRSQP